MKKNLIRILLIILLFYTCYIIFNFSNQNGEESSGVSKKVTDIIVSNILQISDYDEGQITQKLEPIIRKLAHFSIYSIVGFLLMALLSTYQLKEIRRILISLGLGIFYASLDEIHQKFIPGRSAKITDVFIDTMGVILGIMVVVIVLKIVTTKKHKNVEK